MKINTIVVDDEPLSLGMLEAYVRKTPFLELSGSFSSALDALDVLRGGKVGLVFLDIQMPEMTGLELSGLMPSQTKVVFTTAFEQYAVEGFRVDAVDYLLKPIRYADFLKAAERARRRFESEGSVRSMFVKTDSVMVQVMFEDILFVEASGDYVTIRLGNGQRIMTHLTMKDTESMLPVAGFFRVHRSYIVNMDCVTSYDRFGIRLGGFYVPIAESARDEFVSRLRTRSVVR